MIGNTHERLCAASLAGAAVDPRQVRLPSPVATRAAIGIVHLGAGAFHRAHQAVYTEDAMTAAHDPRWGVLAVTGRSDTVARRLTPQDCRYGLLVKDADTTRLRVIGALREAAWPGRQGERVVEAIAAATTHVVTATVTEKGYHATPARTANLDDPAVTADVRLIATELRSLAGDANPHTGQPARTPLGLLALGLLRRFARGGRPLSVVSCDNLRDNGTLTRTVVLSLLAAARPADPAGHRLDEALRWFDAQVAFPGTMVDRITPATTAADHAEAEALLGLRDEALTVTEPFSQWVIEDRFAGPRPAWEKAGATLTADVAGYERMKLHLLNAAHSTLAYLGILHGHATIAQAAADPEIRAAVLGILDEDVIPTLTPPDGTDLARYRDSVLHRFTNPALPHTTHQVAMDGSQKMPIRILETAAENLRAGRVPHGLALAVAAWAVYIARTADGTQDGPLDDPLAVPLQAAVGSLAHLRREPAACCRRLLAVAGVAEDDPVRGDAFIEAVAGRTRPLV